MTDVPRLPDAPDGRLHLGETVDPSTHQRTGTAVALDPAGFTTHGVIVGMTGSGKTGLGVVLLEEALLNGIPTLILDPKGDLGNLLLHFPDLAPGDFAPWVEGTDAATVAQQWKDGLASWGISAERMRRLQEAAAFTILTPGSTAGVPVNIIGSLRNPGVDDEEARHDEIEGVVSGLLGLVGIDSDPLSGREHILLANLVDRAWSAGEDLDLATLLGQIVEPPVRKFGVLDIDTFYPQQDRMALMLKLNGLLASPAFAAWNEGVPLDIERLLWEQAPGGGRGRPRAAVVQLAHLSDDERQFAVTLVLGRLVSWMRDQPGTANLRVLVYFDEVMGFVPPTAVPPTKKPILTLMKQARAFGVGVVLATQNPVDVDYKAISNAGTWMIGRLQTERDRDRLLDGMRSAAGGVDIDALAATISGLGKREFVLHRSGTSTPQVFTSRWAMSYLRGPLTRDQIATLTVDDPLRAVGAAAPTSTPAPAPGAAADGAATTGGAVTAAAAATGTGPAGAAALSDDETPVPPKVAANIPVSYAAPSSPWLGEVGGVPGGVRLQAAVVARIRLLFDDDKAGLRQQEEWEAVVTPLASPLDPASAVAVDYDARDLRPDAPAGAIYRIPPRDIDSPAWWRTAEKQLKDHLVANLSVQVRRNKALGVWSRPDETEEAFAARCELVADQKADAAGATLRKRYETRIDRQRQVVAQAERRADEAQTGERTRKTSELVSGAGALISIFMGGKKGVRSLGRALGGATNRRGMSQRASTRAGSLQDRVVDEQRELEELEQELAEEITAIDDEWTTKAAEIETVDIPLERSDLTVLELGLCWIPVG